MLLQIKVNQFCIYILCSFCHYEQPGFSASFSFYFFCLSVCQLVCWSFSLSVYLSVCLFVVVFFFFLEVICIGTWRVFIRMQISFGENSAQQFFQRILLSSLINADLTQNCWREECFIISRLANVKAGGHFQFVGSHVFPLCMEDQNSRWGIDLSGSDMIFFLIFFFLLFFP